MDRLHNAFKSRGKNSARQREWQAHEQRFYHDEKAKYKGAHLECVASCSAEYHDSKINERHRVNHDNLNQPDSRDADSSYHRRNDTQRDDQRHKSTNDVRKENSNNVRESPRSIHEPRTSHQHMNYGGHYRSADDMRRPEGTFDKGYNRTKPRNQYRCDDCYERSSANIRYNDQVRHNDQVSYSDTRERYFNDRFHPQEEHLQHVHQNGYNLPSHCSCYQNVNTNYERSHNTQPSCQCSQRYAPYSERMSHHAAHSHHHPQERTHRGPTVYQKFYFHWISC